MLLNASSKNWFRYQEISSSVMAGEETSSTSGFGELVVHTIGAGFFIEGCVIDL